MCLVLLGQISLIICCVFYLIWWYRCYRPDVPVSRAKGTNGILLLFTFLFGLAGIILCLLPVEEVRSPKLGGMAIVIGGILLYIILLLITRCLFHRKVTAELFLIVGWTMLETAAVNKLNAAGTVSDERFSVMCVVIATAFLISMVLYVAYYRMEKMRAFYMAMVPLITEAVAMGVFILMMAGE